MIKLKTYSRAAIPSGALDLNELHSEMASCGHITNFACLCLEGDNIDVYGDSLDAENPLDSLVSMHNEDVEKLRESLLDEIDESARVKRENFVDPNMGETHINKRKEAQAFRDAGNPENDIAPEPPFSTAIHPYVSAYKKSNDLPTGQDAADEIINAADQSSGKDADIEHHRNKGKKRVRSSSDRAEMRARRDEAIASINVLE
jgi:hypothetical protein